MNQVDVAIIGLGSAGEALASTLAGAGRQVVGFEPKRIGGECPFTACMPSKVMLHHASLDEPEWAAACEHRDDVINDLDDSGHHDSLVDAGVEVVRRSAVVTGERTVRAGEDDWEADIVVLATGSDAVMPPIEGLDQQRCWTSEDLMTAEELPASSVIVGGGVIGCESAAILAGFGRRVVLVEAAHELLDGAVEPAVGEKLRQRLGQIGVEVWVGAEVTAIEHRDDDDVVRLGEDDVAGSVVLMAVGQAPNWHGLGLDAIGIDADDKPEVDVDYRVAGRDWLRAIGDVDGRSPWTHGANHEADRLAELLTSQDPRPAVTGMPACIFTDPPAASVGLTAARAAEEGYDVVCGSANYSDVARWSTDRLFDGTVVVVADRSSGRLLGCSGVGARFDDTVSVVAALLRSHTTLEEATQFILPFPTMSQVLTPAFQSALDAR